MLARPELLAAERVALYAALPHEVPLRGSWAACWKRGTATCFPRVAADGLEICDAESFSDLAPGAFGVWEPRGPALDPTLVDVFVVPGLLFDRSGRRLGFGRGHYDRLLSAARPDAVRLGLCYAERVVSELPQQAHDVVLDCVLTDLGEFPGRDRTT